MSEEPNQSASNGGAASAPGPARPQSPPDTSRPRRVVVRALIAVATVLAVVGMLSVWANRLLFNPDNWENASTQLLQNRDIRNATSNYLVDQLYANVNVPGVLRSGLPPRLAPLAGPAAGALRNAAIQGVELALARPRIQTLWAKANRTADQAFIAVVSGGTRNVRVNQGVVSLNLASVLDQIAVGLGLPSTLAAKLPPSVGHLTVLRSNQLKYLQDGGDAIRKLALWLTIITPLLYGAAIILARGHRRRTLMTVGFAIVVAGLLGIVARRLLQSQITNELVSDASLRPAIHATIGVATSILGTIAGALILIGGVLVAAAWCAGPAHLAVICRRAIAPFLRERPLPTFAVVTALMLLVFLWDPIPATGTPVGIVVFLGLALLGAEALRRQTAVEFPDARRGQAAAAIRRRWQAIGAGRSDITHDAGPPAAGLADQLARLAALERGGAITGEEYDAAKARLLHA